MTKRTSVLGRYGVPRESALMITGVLYRGAGLRVLEALRTRGINAASVRHARGASVGDPPRRSGLPRYYEKDVLNVVVPPEQGDEVLQLIFDAADIDRRTGGFAYVRRLSRAMPFALPEVPGAVSEEADSG